VGDRAFCDRVRSNPGSLERFVNFNDAVTHVPLESLLYRHAPSECQRFDEHGVLDVGGDEFTGDISALRAAISGLPQSVRFGDLTQIPAPPSVVDHSPARYCFRLWDCV